uniref:Putative secreted protein n=1 Tax=Anopheles marajoara TaxID=58244 RepID=A0A2M4C7G4_9DIPT
MFLLLLATMVLVRLVRLFGGVRCRHHLPFVEFPRWNGWWRWWGTLPLRQLPSNILRPRCGTGETSVGIKVLHPTLTIPYQQFDRHVTILQALDALDARHSRHTDAIDLQNFITFP